jgi:ubiquinone biosynthesis protein
VVGYVDFGITGSLGDAARESLTRYAWHLFRGDTDRAINELMRWIAPAGRTSHEFTKTELVRIHDEFLASLQRGDRPAPAATIFAVAIFDVINRLGLAISPDVLAYFRALVMADTIRLQLAPNFDLQTDVRRFFARLVAQQTREWVDPRSLVHAAYEYGHRLSRVLDAVESQHTTAGVIEAALLNIQSRVQVARRRLRTLIVLAVATCAGLLVALQNPDVRTAGPLPSEGRNWIPAFMVAVIAVLLVLIYFQRRSLRKSVVLSNGQASSYLVRQWEHAQTQLSNPYVK